MQTPRKDAPLAKDDVLAAPESDMAASMDNQPDGDRQLSTDSAALDEGGSNDSDLGADVAGDIGPKHA